MITYVNGINKVVIGLGTSYIYTHRAIPKQVYRVKADEDLITKYYDCKFTMAINDLEDLSNLIVMKSLQEKGKRKLCKNHLTKD